MKTAQIQRLLRRQMQSRKQPLAMSPIGANAFLSGSPGVPALPSAAAAPHGLPRAPWTWSSSLPSPCVPTLSLIVALAQEGGRGRGGKRTRPPVLNQAASQGVR